MNFSCITVLLLIYVNIPTIYIYICISYIYVYIIHINICILYICNIQLNAAKHKGNNKQTLAHIEHRQ